MPAENPEAPSYTQMYLGPIEFVGFEIPEKLPLGHTQKVVVNQYVGKNRRAVHALGSQPREIAWDGRFLYQTAVARARYLDTLTQKADTLIFVYGDFVFRTVIEEFLYEIHNVYDIQYSIKLQVVADLTDPFTTLVKSQDTIEQGLLGILSLLGDIFALFKKAVAFVKAIKSGDIGKILGSITTLTSALGNVNNIFSLGLDEIKTYAKEFNILALTAQTIVNQVADFASGNGNPLLSDFADGPGVDLDGPSAVALEGTRIVNLATTAEALLRRLLEPPYTTQLTVMGTNLFDLAVKYYGTIDAWETIADFNNLTEARLIAPQQIALPPYNGILPLMSKDPHDIYDIGLYNIPPGESLRSPSQGRTYR